MVERTDGGDCAAVAPLPEFRMPACWRHFFKGHRWWCRPCDREAEREFEDTAVALWTLQRATDATSPPPVPVDGNEG